jgi:CheY-like chemotaxis protein
VSDEPKILIADDEDAARYGMVRAISAHGYRIEEAADGEAALQKISEFEPVAQMLGAWGTLSMAVGAGFVISAAMSYVISSRMGLLGDRKE